MMKSFIQEKLAPLQELGRQELSGDTSQMYDILAQFDPSSKIIGDLGDDIHLHAGPQDGNAHRIWIAQDDVAIGYTLTQLVNDPAIGKYVVTEDIVVHPSFRSQGIRTAYYTFWLDNGNHVVSSPAQTDSTIRFFRKLVTYYESAVVYGHASNKEVIDGLNVFDRAYENEKLGSFILVSPQRRSVPLQEGIEGLGSAMLRETQVADRSGAPITVFHGSDTGVAQIKDGGMFFTQSYQIAADYGHIVMAANLDIQDGVTFDFDGRSTIWFNEQSRTPSQLVKAIIEVNADLKAGYGIDPDSDLRYDLQDADWYIYSGEDYIDGIILKNIDDSMDMFGGEISTHYVVFSADQVKILDRDYTPN